MLADFIKEIMKNAEAFNVLEVPMLNDEVSKGTSDFNDELETSDDLICAL